MGVWNTLGAPPSDSVTKPSTDSEASSKPTISHTASITNTKNQTSLRIAILSRLEICYNYNMHTVLCTRTTRFRSVVGLLVLFVLGMIAMRFAARYVSSVSGGAGIFDLNFGNDGTYIHDNLLALGGAGKSAYLYIFLPIDTVYVAIYAVYYAYALAFFLQRTINDRWNCARWVIFLPVLGAVCDWLENVSFTFMLIQPSGSIDSLLVTSTSLLTKTKFVLVYLSLLLVLGLAATWLVCYVRAKRNRRILQ